jgi:hypothetical protein
MNPMNHEMFDEIKSWVESGEWRNQENFSYEYDEEEKACIGVYTAPWFMDLTEEEFEAINWDEGEEDFYSFMVVIHIYEDNTYKLEFDPGLFDLMYKGYDTEADRQAWDEFRDMAEEKGVLY